MSAALSPSPLGRLFRHVQQLDAVELPTKGKRLTYGQRQLKGLMLQAGTIDPRELVNQEALGQCRQEMDPQTFLFEILKDKRLARRGSLEGGWVLFDLRCASELMMMVGYPGSPGLILHPDEVEVMTRWWS